MPAVARLVNHSTGAVVAGHLEIADSFVARFRGLMLRAGLPPGGGLLIEPCSSIHMLFMRFPIDAVFVDRDLRVLAVRPRLRPWIGLAAARGARAVIELPVGAAQGIHPGDHLGIDR